MKNIRAIIKPTKLQEVSEILTDLGVKGITIFEGKGHGRQNGHTEIFRGSEYEVDFLPKIVLDVVVEDELEEQVVQGIIKVCRQSGIGSGKIFVTDVVRAIRIGDGEEGDKAL